MVKKLKNLLQNHKSFKAEFWCIALRTQGLQVCSNDDPRLTFDVFRGIKFASLCICMGKILKTEFLIMY